MAEWQVLFDAVSVRGIDERRLAQSPATFGAFALAQMAPASAPEQDLAPAGYLETFAYRFSGFYTFGSAHRDCFRDWVVGGENSPGFLGL